MKKEVLNRAPRGIMSISKARAKSLQSCHSIAARRKACSGTIKKGLEVLKEIQGFMIVKGLDHSALNQKFELVEGQLIAFLQFLRGLFGRNLSGLQDPLHLVHL